MLACATGEYQSPLQPGGAGGNRSGFAGGLSGLVLPYDVSKKSLYQHSPYKLRWTLNINVAVVTRNAPHTQVEMVVNPGILEIQPEICLNLS